MAKEPKTSKSTKPAADPAADNGTAAPATDSAPPESPAPPPASVPATSAKTSKVKVRVVGKQPLYEGQVYHPGEVFETTAQRAKALGPVVEIVTE